MSSAQVQAFLQDFKVKLGIWGVTFHDYRSKNAQALLDLDIRPFERRQILLDLQVSDYCEGPLPEKLYGSSEMWVFGKIIKGKEVYIKITLGLKDLPVICISFHIAEHPMKHLKK